MKNHKLLLLGILLFAACVRFFNLNWDSNFHLHPDERFLTMVVAAITFPATLSLYFHPDLSSLNPVNNNFSFFVYGLFPLTLTKLFAILANGDSYNTITIVGRMLSAAADTAVVFILYKICELLEKKLRLRSDIKFLAAFFYAVAVLPVQLAHFFATDTFLNFFLFLSLYFSMKFWDQKKFIFLLLSGIMAGCAMTSKISAVFFLPLIGYYLLKGCASFPLFSKKTIVGGILFLFVMYLTMRFTDPYMFANSNLLNPKINPVFIQNLQTQKGYGEGKDIWFPPAIQWINKAPIAFSLTNVAFFGIGLPIFFFFLAGVYESLTIKKQEIALFLFFTLAFFLYQSTQFVKAMRYFFFLYPFFALIAALGFSALTRKMKLPVKSILLFICSLWLFAFISIYFHLHSRVAATIWAHEHIPVNSTILYEYWDDPLPLPMVRYATNSYNLVPLPVFDQDTPEKWQRMQSLFDSADYYILSSNRGWGSMPTVPRQYPQMTRFYADLFAGKTPFTLIKEFTSYPSFSYIGIPLDFPDQWADETFTVYDHPKVMIFKRNR